MDLRQWFSNELCPTGISKITKEKKKKKKKKRKNEYFYNP